MENLGSLAILLAFAVALYATVASVVGRLKNKPFLIVSGERAVYSVWVMMLLASGVNFGFRRTIPHMLGIGFGFTAMLVVVGLGLGAALAASTSLLTVLKLVSAGYMLWLAWRLASSGSIGSAVGAANPMRFIEAAGFQWINPKAWAMALTATTVYTRPDAFLATVLIVGAWHIRTGYASALAFYAPHPQPALALTGPWREGGWKELPPRRIDLDRVTAHRERNGLRRGDRTLAGGDRDRVVAARHR